MTYMVVAHYVRTGTVTNGPKQAKGLVGLRYAFFIIANPENEVAEDGGDYSVE